MRFRLRRPSEPTTTALILGAIALAGYVVIGVAWHGTAETLHVIFQLPWLVSAGFAGVALVVSAFALQATYDERRESAARRADATELLAQTNNLVDLVERRVVAYKARRAAAAPAPARRRRTAAATTRSTRSTRTTTPRARRTSSSS